MFYISSRGSSATWWLAETLSKHPNIVCFGSTRSFPPVEPGKAFPSVKSWINTLDANKFIDGLKICEEATRGKKIFGSTHGYHGLDIKDACEKKDGTFLYIVRDPLEKIHSAFITTVYKNYLKPNPQFNINNEETHKFTCEKIKDINLDKFTQKEIKQTTNILKVYTKKTFPNFYQKLKDLKFYKYNQYKRKNKNQSVEELLSSCFVNTINSFFYYDYFLAKNCQVSEGIKMEKMVSDKEYFYKKILVKINPNDKKNENYLNSIINTPRVNIHRAKPLKGPEIWSVWPENMKRTFLHLFKKYEIEKICKNFNYDISYLK